MLEDRLYEGGGNIIFLINLLVSYVGHPQAFSQEFLKLGSDEKNYNSSVSFLRDIEIRIDLTKLIDEKLLNIYRHQYLLQVWSFQGRKIFERPLNNIVNLWNIANEYFIYKPEKGDENYDYFHIVNLENANSTFLINDDFNDAQTNQDIIYVMEIVDTLKPGEVAKMKIKDRMFQEIDPGALIQSIFIYNDTTNSQSQSGVIVILETIDNQLDFSELIIKNLGYKDYDFEFIQKREVVPRSIRCDDVVKISYIIDHTNVVYCLALRNSGVVDIYWNMSLVDVPDNVSIRDVQCSFDTLYVQLKNGEVRGISTSLNSQVNFNQSYKEKESFVFDFIFFQNIKNKAHGPFISVFDISTHTWRTHYQFQEGNIIAFIKNVVAAKDVRETDKIEIIVILESGQIYFDIQTKILNRREEELEYQIIQPEKKNILNVEGRILKVTWDKLTHEWIYILTTFGNENCNLYGIRQNKVYQLLQGEGGLKNPITDEKVQLKKILRNDLGFVDLCLPNCENLHSCITMDIEDHIILFDDNNVYLYKRQKKKLKIFPEQCCTGIYTIDKNYCYSLNHRGGSKSSGLKLYDLNNLISQKTKQTNSKLNSLQFLLDKIQVGINGHLDWNPDSSRLTFLSSLQSLNIIPVLHRNTMSFIGMNKRNAYLATAAIKDKFIALDKFNQLFTWSILTGKLIAVNQLSFVHDYSNFQVFVSPGSKDANDVEYKREWYSKILLVKNQPERIQDLAQTPEGEPSYVINQSKFLDGIAKEYREFRLISIINELEVFEHARFVFPIYQNSKQKLYFDEKVKYMIEKFDNQRVFVYQKEAQFAATTDCNWIQIKRFNSFPEELQNDMNYLNVMSPCFQYYIDIDRVDKQMVIKEMLNQQIIYRIDRYLMNPILEDKAQIMKRFKWVDSHSFRIINQHGIEKIFDMTTKKEVNYNVIPIFDRYELSDPKRHYFFNRVPLSIKQVLERLKKKYQQYKSAFFLEKKLEPHQLYSVLFNVDYQIDNCKGIYVSELSFTYLHWKMIELIASKDIQIQNIHENQIELLCYNIFPGGNTVLHKLQGVDGQIENLYKFSLVDLKNEEDDVNIRKFHIPFLKNIKNKSPMHICKDNQDIKTINQILLYLSGYDVDHHSRALADLYPLFVSKKLPNLVQYLDSRMLQTEDLKLKQKGIPLNSYPTVADIPLWHSNEEINQKLVILSESNEQLQFQGDMQEIQEQPQEQKLELHKHQEKKYKLEVIDIPEIYHYQHENFLDLSKALAKTNQFKIFQKKAIQKLLEFNYPLLKKYCIKSLFIPFTWFQLTFFLYLNFVFQQSNPFLRKLDLPMQAILGIYSCYFLWNEVIQMKNERLRYFTNMFNYIDIITPMAILTLLFINSFSIKIDPQLERSIQAVGVFFMWFKFLYFFRVFETYGFFIRLMISVIADMGTFFFVMLFTIVAFSDSLLTISNGNFPEDQFVFSYHDSIIYTYRIILGDFNTEQFGKISVWLVFTLFILCTVFNTIVMLNLLIAIIGETYENVKKNQPCSFYQEKAAVIAENFYLLKENDLETYATKGVYLITATDLSEALDEGKDELCKHLDYIKDRFLKKINSFNQGFVKLKQKLTLDFSKAQEYNENLHCEVKRRILALQDQDQSQSQVAPPIKYEEMTHRVTQNLRNQFLRKSTQRPTMHKKSSKDPRYPQS